MDKTSRYGKAIVKKASLCNVEMMNNNKKSWLQNLDHLIKRLNIFGHTINDIDIGNNTTLKSKSVRKMKSILETKWSQEVKK